MAECDALVIGAGHNGLICAAYLARAGYRVIVVERRATVGGAVVTEEIIPGYQFDLGGSAHILIHHTPIVRELELERYGLEYIDLDPIFFAPFPDGSSVTIWKDLERTCASIAAISPEDADAYRSFVRRWQPLAEGMVRSFLEAPTPANLVKNLVMRPRMAGDPLVNLSAILRGYGHTVRRSFRDPRIQAVVGWMAAQSGPPPGEPLSAAFALWHPMYHISGVKRPRGGSGRLTQAIARRIQADGGMIVAGAPVERILVRGGRAIGARTTGGMEIRARSVVAATHILTTLKLIGEEALPRRVAALAGDMRTGNGFGMVVRYAMEELPNYTALPSDGPAAHHHALQFICPSLEYLERAYGDYLAGRPSQEPALVAMTFSAADTSLAPPGKHTLYLWGQYYPYELASGERWDDIGEREAERMLDTLAEYAPNVRRAVVGKLVEHPLYLERELGLVRGNVMHLDMAIDQMFLLRPALTMSRYRGPIPGLYLTGASTHPGGGIMGASGRNAAQVILSDLERRKV